MCAYHHSCFAIISRLIFVILPLVLAVAILFTKALSIASLFVLHALLLVRISAASTISSALITKMIAAGLVSKSDVTFRVLVLLVLSIFS